MARKLIEILFFLFLVLCLPSVVFAEIVTEFDNLEVSEGGFVTLRVKLDSAPGGSLTVSVDEVTGGDTDIYPSTVCTFVFWYDASSPDGQEVRVALYDGETPATVANFLNYVTYGDYNGTFIHRLVPGFIFQGGGYGVNTVGQNSYIEQLPADPPVVNEPNRSNFRGTIAMAKLPTGPDTATSEWFFNLADNRPNLDFQNGGFTAFGEVIDGGMTVVDEIGALPPVDMTGTLGSGFGSLPLHDWGGTGLTLDNLVWLDEVTVSLGREVTFDNANWNQWQEITIHAAPDDDGADGTTTFRLSGTGLSDHDVVVVERDNAVGLVFEEPIPAIPEGGSVEIQVKLAGQPSAAVNVAATRIDGDSDLSPGSPDTAAFAPGEWDTFKPIAITAAEDANAVNQTAIFKFGGSGVHDELVVLAEADNDQLAIELEDAEPITAPEGEITTFRVRLTAQPLGETDVLFEWQSGDSDISRATALRFDTPAGSFDVELFDQQTPSAVGNFINFIQSGEYDGLFFHNVPVPGGEVRSGRYSYSTSENFYSYVGNFPLDGFETGGGPNERGALALHNPGAGALTTEHWFINTGTGPANAVVFGRVLGDGMAIVDQISALSTYDVEADLEAANPQLELEGSLENVPMQGWDGTGIPGTDRLVYTGITLTSLPRFNSSNWNQWQTVTIRAQDDADFLAGEAIFRIQPEGGFYTDITIAEVEKQLTLEVDSETLALPEGGNAVALGIRLASPPDAAVTVEVQLGDIENADITIDGEASVEFTPQDYDWKYVSFLAAEDAQTISGQAIASLVPSVGVEIIPVPPQVTLNEVDDDVAITVQAGDHGSTVPDGEQVVDTNDPAVWPLPIAATADTGYAFSHWESGTSSLVENERMPDTSVILAESATVTAIFDTDNDGDQLPDEWETEMLAGVPGAKIEDLTPDGDPNRNGQSTRQDYYDDKDPLRYEITMLDGWNCLGLGANPQQPSTRQILGASRDDGVQASSDIGWDWTGNVYRLEATIVPYRGQWIHVTSGGTLGIPVRLQDPPAVAQLRQGWNLVVIDLSEHTGLITDIFAGATAPIGWAWKNGVLWKTEKIELDVATGSAIPTWVYAPQAVDQALGKPDGR